MPNPTNPASQTAAGPESSRFALREPLGVWLAVVGVLAIAGLLSLAVPWVHENLLGIVALAFLGLPRLVLARRDKGPEDYGLTTHGMRKGLVVGIITTLVVLAGFVPVWHLWATHGLGLVARPDAAAYVQPTERLWGPPHVFDDGRIFVWTDREQLHIAAAPATPVDLSVYSDGQLIPPRQPDTQLQHVAFVAPADTLTHRSYASRGGSELRVTATRNDAPLSADDWATGAGARAPTLDEEGGLRIPLSARWVLWAVLLQLLLVSLPEEFFFRGYLQRRFDELRPRRILFRIGPIEISQTHLIVSALFALTHVILTPWPSRLAVFFPSLLFCWLRDRTDGLAAPILFHAACNLMVQLAAAHYLP